MIRRIAVLLTGIALATVVSCGSNDDKAANTLPPVSTTTTTTTTIAPTTTLPEFYVVKAGDILSEIAKQFGISQTELMAANNITNPDKIRSGQKLVLPPPTTTAPPPTPAPTEPISSVIAQATTG